MTTRYLERFFHPSSIAVLGASERPGSLGGVVLRNLQSAGFEGKLMAVNPRGGKTIFGVARAESIAALSEPPDLAVVCTSPHRVPAQLRELGERGVKAALVVMGGLSLPKPAASGLHGAALRAAVNLLGLELESGQTLLEATREATDASGIRVMGPNCIGVLVPSIKLNASYAHLDLPPGDVAFVTDSGVLGLAMIDYAHGHGLGFSHLLSLGDSLDVSLTDVIEYLADDRDTRTLLIHLEQMPPARAFLSAVRAASRTKLVLVLKSARHAALQSGGDVADGGLIDRDTAFDAALRRVGALRLQQSDEMAALLEHLKHIPRLRGERLAILCNGRGPGVLAADHLLGHGGELAALAPATLDRIAEELPAFWARTNPVDIQVNAVPGRFKAVLDAVVEDEGVDAVLVIHVPTLAAPSGETASVVIGQAQTLSKPVLTCWMGYRSARDAREACIEAGISTFNSPEQAVTAFLRLVHHRRTQARLHQTPPPVSADDRPDLAEAWFVVRGARHDGRDWLTHREATAVLRAYGIPMAETRYAADPAGLAEAVRDLPGPWAVEVVHARGCRPFAYARGRDRPRAVAFDLYAAADLEAAARRLADGVARRFPESRIVEYAVQSMRRGLHSIKLHAGITRDPMFGPLVLYGAGGNPHVVEADRRVGLPPINPVLAGDLLESSSTYGLLGEHSVDLPRDREALCRLLIRITQLIIDVPVIRGLEINPVLLNREGIVALDGQIDIGDPAPTVLSPYPAELSTTHVLPRSGRTVDIRPIRGEDEPSHLEFFRRLSPETVRLRLFSPKTHLSHEELALLTQIDYAREMAFIASAANETGEPETLGVVRAWTDADNIRAEFAVVVRDDQRGEGLGRLLMKTLIDYTRARGVLQLVGTVLPENRPMLRLARGLGFENRYDEEEEAEIVHLLLNDPREEWQRERLV